MKNKTWQFCWMFTILLGMTFLYSVHPAQCKSKPGEKFERMRTGWVFFIDDKSVTLDDMQFWLSSGTKFYTKNGSATSGSYFTKGLFVGLRLGEKKVVTEMRELNPTSNDIPPSSHPTAPSSQIVEEDAPPANSTIQGSGMYFEDGVWKN